MSMGFFTVYRGYEYTKCIVVANGCGENAECPRPNAELQIVKERLRPIWTEIWGIFIDCVFYAAGSVPLWIVRTYRGSSRSMREPTGFAMGRRLHNRVNPLL